MRIALVLFAFSISAYAAEPKPKVDSATNHSF